MVYVRDSAGFRKLHALRVVTAEEEKKKERKSYTLFPSPHVLCLYVVLQQVMVVPINLLPSPCLNSVYQALPLPHQEHMTYEAAHT